ncbi:hypothetical protein ALC60_12863 [Trachymyrmex zeteki]|uniref:Chromo domain-containing protein n=1 Tax=Mycetomoellerius zeteki TaxID=64791 RepID=A0A151WJU5_9HYME|nr:hypothetical protein ALC60_12863 [Trachymyrmex zeteki]
MADVCEREKIVREIQKTSESIRKKHRALKTGKIEESMELGRHFKPIIKPLRQIVDSPGLHAIKRESRDDDAASAPKRERKEEEEEEEEASETFERSATLRISDDRFNIGCKRRKVERRCEPAWARWDENTSREESRKGEKVYVKWLGFDGSHNSWIHIIKTMSFKKKFFF